MTSPFHLQRFKDAQAHHHDQALAEIKNGKKVSHWMWFIFPQIRGLGFSSSAIYYSIASKEEAKAYLLDVILSDRLLEITYEVLQLKVKNPQISAVDIFDEIDALKLRSSLTLFSEIVHDDDELKDEKFQIFRQTLDIFYMGEIDQATLDILHRE